MVGDRGGALGSTPCVPPTGQGRGVPFSLDVLTLTHTPVSHKQHATHPSHSPSPLHPTLFLFLLRREKARTADLADAQRRANLGKAEAGGELQKLKQENDQLRAIIGERDEDLKVYQEAVAELKGELEDANEEIEELEGMLRSSKRKVEEGDNDIKDRDKSLVDLQT